MIAPGTRNGIIVAVLFVLGAVWLSRGAREGDARRIEGFNTRLDYAVTDVRLLVLDEAGGPRMVLEAPRLVSNADTGVGEVEQPSVVLNEEGVEWHIDAQSATIAPDRDHVELAGDVRLRRPAGPGMLPFRLDTERLAVVVSERRASTDAPVTLVEGGNRLNAVGMTLDMIDETYQLQHEVRGSYVMAPATAPSGGP